MLPIFDAMMKNGNNMMGSNPMMQMFGGQQQAQHPMSTCLTNRGHCRAMQRPAPVYEKMQQQMRPASDVDLSLLVRRIQKHQA